MIKNKDLSRVYFCSKGLVPSLRKHYGRESKQLCVGKGRDYIVNNLTKNTLSGNFSYESLKNKGPNDYVQFHKENIGLTSVFPLIIAVRLIPRGDVCIFQENVNCKVGKNDIKTARSSSDFLLKT